MRLLKKCVRCKSSFLATKNMLVCSICYGNNEDNNTSDILVELLKQSDTEDSLKKISQIIKKLENTTCKNPQRVV